MTTPRSIGAVTREANARDGIVCLRGYHDTGDLDARRDRFLVRDLAPGDRLLFDFRTLHRATCPLLPRVYPRGDARQCNAQHAVPHSRQTLEPENPP